jgi:ABC-type multidrug transport system ATPase subunit
MSNKFEFSDICYTVDSKKKGIKTILSKISGVCLAGEVMAILGPSGAGKTSLLNVLTLNALSGVSKGMCRLNGVNMTDNIFREHCCIVPQEDHHRAFLTARQTLMYVADFYIQGSDETKKKEVDTLITKLGLDVCADTLVGNQFFVGLSGGQKKRLSVAVALLKKPSVMMLDEPTSGLDAASSFHVMKFIKALTKERGICTICTIHQPSSPIYMDFDNVMLLSQGRCAFLGTPERSITYFDEKGYNMPKFSNPAEYLLDCINNDFTDAADVTKILNLWSASEATELANKTGGTVATNTALPPDRESIPFKLQFWYLLRRQAHVVATDPMIYIGRAVMFLMACIFFAIVYVESRDRIQEQVLNRLWLTMWLVGVPSSLGVIGVYAFNEEFKTLRKGVKNGMF